MVLAVALVAVGAVQTDAAVTAAGSVEDPSDALGAPDLQGVWTSADLSVPSDDAPRVARGPATRAGRAGGRWRREPAESLGRANSARDVQCVADDAAGTGACRDAKARTPAVS